VGFSLEIDMRKHWYLFSFSTPSGFANSYQGLKKKTPLTRGNIRFAQRTIEKQYNFQRESVICVSISYLGYMSKEELED
jgi:hypothetical protein